MAARDPVSATFDGTLSPTVARSSRQGSSQGTEGRRHGTGKSHQGAELGISQDELAGRIYVSRQTISSWENDKTYPDVQSLLLPSQVFGMTIDELVRGEVDTMKETVEKDAQLVKHLSYVMVGFIALMLLAMVWWTYQVSIADLPLVQTLPTVVLAVVLWGIAMFASCGSTVSSVSMTLSPTRRFSPSGAASPWIAKPSAVGANGSFPAG